MYVRSSYERVPRKDGDFRMGPAWGPLEIVMISLKILGF